MASYDLFFLLFLFLSPHEVHSISFQINDFDSDSNNMVYQGDAKPLNGSITFDGQLGWATYAQKLLLSDHSNGHLSNFKTHFSFLITNNDQTNSTVHSHGLAFFLAPSEFSPPLNSSGSFLGLYNSTQNESFQPQIVHVEFDTFPNPEWDPPFQHMGINKNSIASSIYTPWNSRDYEKKTHVWISYNATAKNLSVSLNNNATLSHQIDLLKMLPEKVTIGFSTSAENLSIEFWEFSSSNFDANYEEKDDHLQMDESEKAINMKLLAVLIAWVGVFVIAILSIFVVSLARSGLQKKKDQQQQAGMKLASIYSDLNKEASPPRRFSYRYLAMATDNFSMNGKLGQGGFGAVFKGHLPGANKTVAVKRFFKGSTQGKREYVSEVKIISHMRHDNLVKLIGWCHERDNSEFLLVYEFMPNGSLDSHLFRKSPPLPWPLRYKISLGLASALLYLHEEREHSVIHRDIKSSNVLLDFNFTAKLGDFGLARLAKHELNSKTPRLVGTFGYMAPEYISSGRASKESDIFSFGVVLLEIVSGRKCCDHSGKGLVEMVWDAYGRGELVEAILDEKLREGFVEAREVERLSVVGLWSAHPHAAQRPSIKEVIQVLSFEEAMPNLPKQMPLPTFYHASLELLCGLEGHSRVQCSCISLSSNLKLGPSISKFKLLSISQVEAIDFAARISLPSHVKAITSTSNPFVKHCVKLRFSYSYRHLHGSVLVVGIIPIREICKFQESLHGISCTLECVLLLDEVAIPEGLVDISVRIVRVSPTVMKKVSGMQSTESIDAIALMKIPNSFYSLDGNLKEAHSKTWFPTPHRILVLEGIQDPGNLGTLIRSALAFKWNGAFLLPGRCDPFNEKALRASRGASFQLPIVSGTWNHLEALKTEFQMKMLAGHPESNEPKPVLVLSQQFANSLKDFPLCLVLGSEGSGLSEKSWQVCELMSIPKAGAYESLNVSVAGGIFLYMLQAEHHRHI